MRLSCDELTIERGKFTAPAPRAPRGGQAELVRKHTERRPSAVRYLILSSFSSRVDTRDGINTEICVFAKK